MRRVKRLSRRSWSSVRAVPMGETALAKPGLVQGDHVQVAFDDHHLVLGADGLAGLVQAVEQAAFVEQRRLG